MLNRSALLALVDEAARDPSIARRRLELVVAMVGEEMRRGDFAMPPGYIYSGAHTWLAPFDAVVPEPLPAAGTTVPQRDPLSNTANPTQPIEVPFDALILGVSGWCSPRIPAEASTNALVGGLLGMGAEPEGRDLFSVGWNLDGNTHFITDGYVSQLEPAAAVVGTRTAPRALGWLVQRKDTINVRVRNLTNVAVPFAWYVEQPEPYGWELDIWIAFTALNLERP